MNTNRLKPFAQQARKLLMEGVKTRLLFWGFDEKKGLIEQPEEIPGGLIFRGEVYNDPSLFKKWLRLKSQIEQHSFKDVVEEAAYTWFNRLMAIKILEKNGHEEMTIGLNGTSPAILQNAIGGLMPFLNAYDRSRVQQFILDGKEDEAFGVLLTGFCRANQLLNRVFGGINDFTELLLPTNLLATENIVDLLNKNGFIEENDYKEVELIGWLYQFYISDRKDEVFKGFKENKKARKEDIPAATQIFTPKWIVKYMVENTVGATWLEHYPESEIRESLKYLVENQSNETETVKDSISAIEINLLDPAVGSGHILVTAFDLYMMMYKEEGFTTRQAVREILKNNLFGLDIDKRATQLARFAVLMKAAKYDADILKEESLPQIFPMPEPFFFDRRMVEDFLNGTINSEENLSEAAISTDVKSQISGELVLEFPEPYETLLEKAIIELAKALHLMLQAQNLGSSMIFNLSDSTKKLIRLNYQEFQIKAQAGKLNLDQLSWWITLQQYLDPLQVLTSQFSCVVANPPYMGQKSMNAELKNYVNEKYPMTKSDLFAVFMEVCLSHTIKRGLMGMINQHSWMFLSSFDSYRSEILTTKCIKSMLHLGPRVFEELSGEVVQSTTFVISNLVGEIAIGEYYRLTEFRTNKEKHDAFLKKENLFSNVKQSIFSKISGAPIAYWVSEQTIRLFEENSTLGAFSPARIGMMTTDNERFVRAWYEVSLDSIGFDFKDRSEAIASAFKWFPYNKGGGFRKWYGNNSLVVNWGNGGKEIANTGMNSFRGKDFYFKEGITWSFVNASSFGVRYKSNGFIFDIGGSSAFPDKSILLYTIAFLNSKVSYYFLFLLNPTMNFQAGNINNLPFINSIKHKDTIDRIASENISICKEEWDSKETSWDFKSSPLLMATRNLQESYDEWHKKITNWYFKLLKNEIELNRLFIEIYHLENEINPDLEVTEITIFQDLIDFDKLIEFKNNFEDKLLPIYSSVVIQNFVSYFAGCFMGRYHIINEGLHIAQPSPKDDMLISYNYKNEVLSIDEDAIIPLMDSDSPFTNNIVSLFKYFLHMIWGEETLTENINFVNTSLGMDIEKYLTEKFWDFHKKMYQKKPIYWLFTSPEGNFKVLTYMHRMDKFTVQKIRLNYLMRYIDFLRDKIQQAEANNEQGRTIDKLRKALADCLEYDKILKPLADQQITFDLDDGVTVNYEKFKGAVAPLR